MNSNSIHDQLKVQLKKLRLPTVLDQYADIAESARRESLSYERYLFELSDAETTIRKQKRVERFLRESKLPLEKTIDVFNRQRLPASVNGQVSVLLEGGFLARTENILAFGNPGSGKTHLLCAIGHQLIQQGYRVLFRPCSLLVQELLLAKKDLNLPKALKKLSKYDAIIIDDIGYVQHSRQEMEVLFTLLAERYERGSVMLTSNLPFSGWESIFKDPMTTAAAIDRLVHHSIILELNLSSYRLESSQSRKESGKKSDEAIGEK
jgi:DNA replication protein DnaC